MFLLVGNFNTDLAALEGWVRYKEIMAAMAAAGLEDFSGHFLPRHKPWLKDGRTWSIHRRGQEVHSHTEYILGKTVI